MTNSRPSGEPSEPAEAWRALCRTLEAAGERVLGPDVPGSPRDRAEGFRYLARFLQAGIASCLSHDDPDHPVLGRMIDYSMPWGLDNPDCLYLYAGIRSGASYRLTGSRGSARHIDFQVNFGHYAHGDVSSWGTIDSLDGLDLATDDSGCFELVLSAEPRAGNALQLGPDAEFVLIRQYFHDWENEQPADILIERLDTHGPVPPPTPEFVASRLEKLARWMEQGGGLWLKMSQGFLALPPNSLVIHAPDAAGERSGMRGLAYGIGNFRCRPDEAVILEFVPPRCRYWGLSLANEWWECIEYASRQSSLNGHQAVLDSDGVFRGVIAHRDPGVANWLDPAGLTRGTLAARFLHGETDPEIRFRVVPVAELANALPADTPRVSAEARADALERRRRAVIRRFRQ